MLGYDLKGNFKLQPKISVALLVIDVVDDGLDNCLELNLGAVNLMLDFLKGIKTT